jgi:UDP-glucose 4-epimerase
VKVLVTGGAGFVGSNLIKSLVADSVEVYSLDNYFTGDPSNHTPGAVYITGSTEDIHKNIDFTPDIVYHFGEYSRISTSFEDIEKVWDYNVRGTSEVIKFCLSRGSKLIYSASSTKFGDNGDNRYASPYAFYKSSNTELIKSYNAWFGLEYAICYFYNVYGAGQISKGKYATVIGIFEDKFSKNHALPVVLPGTQKRDFTHVNDVVSGLKLLSNSSVSGDGYCFGTGKSHTILDVAEMFGSEIQYLPPRLGERMDTSIDLSKSNNIGWRPSIILKDYIKEKTDGKT